MRMEDLGERKIIEKFLENITQDKGAVVGIGDDACVVEFGDEYLVISSDMLSRRSHFPWEMTPEQIGSYVVNANLSDIAAMGAVPFGMLVSLGLPRDLEEDFLEGIGRGIDGACRENEIHLLGGDSKEQEELVIIGTALGRAKKDGVLTRGGAKKGDLICTTGNIGSAAAGFYCLTHDIKINDLINAAIEPEARVKEGQVLSKYASACMDISDGLAYSLHEMARWSGTGFLVREKDLPVDEILEKVAKTVEVPLREMVFFKGGDYELLFTIPEDAVEDAMKELKGFKAGATVIGEVTDGGGKLLTREGEMEDLEERGYDSFRNF